MLRGKLVHAFLRTSDVKSHQNISPLLFKPSGKRGGRFNFFLDDCRAKPCIGDVVCMAIQEDTCRLGLYKFGHYSLGVLVLQQQLSEPVTYRRIGIMMSADDSRDLYRLQESAAAYSITLV